MSSKKNRKPKFVKQLFDSGWKNAVEPITFNELISLVVISKNADSEIVQALNKHKLECEVKVL